MTVEFTLCPDCHKKGVYLKLKGEEDHYRCRYCKFFFFTLGNDRVDRDNEKRWKVENGVGGEATT